ncbi:MAG: hypothetical protein AAGJ86_05385, partial [Pseudomonadota bacterium]
TPHRLKTCGWRDFRLGLASRHGTAIARLTLELPAPLRTEISRIVAGLSGPMQGNDIRRSDFESLAWLRRH